MIQSDFPYYYYYYQFLLGISFLFVNFPWEIPASKMVVYFATMKYLANIMS